MKKYAADDLVFLDEAIFNEKTGWRHRGYGPQGGKVIIMDNVQIHCDEAVRNALEKAGYIVQYLPPYSPDFNPIELSFSVIKVCISRLILGCVNIVRCRRGSSGISYIFAICIQVSKPFY
jgi:transposase